MKIATLAFLFCLVSLNNSFSQQPAKALDSQSITMLKECYTAYNTAWATTKDGFVLIKKLDSLKEKYCTIALRKKLLAEFKVHGLDHDEFIDDQETDLAHLPTLNVVKDPTKQNGYIVSYDAEIEVGADNKKVIKKILIHVTVANEGGELKIASVK